LFLKLLLGYVVFTKPKEAKPVYVGSGCYSYRPC